MVVNFILTTASLAMVHERVPDRNTYGPLPDVVLDNVVAQDWALNVSEVLIMIMSNSAMVFIIFHKHRYVLYTNINETDTCKLKFLLDRLGSEIGHK